jgi:hypothetical protein
MKSASHGHGIHRAAPPLRFADVEFWIRQVLSLRQRKWLAERT